MKQGEKFSRAQKLVNQNKFNFPKELFCKDLNAFLTSYFKYDCLNVEFVEGENCKIVVCISVSDVKNTRMV